MFFHDVFFHDVVPIVDHRKRVSTTQKMRKKKPAFFELFARRSAKKCEKTVFFHVFRGTLYIIYRLLLFLYIVDKGEGEYYAENAKKQRLLSFLRDVPQKV